MLTPMRSFTLSIGFWLSSLAATSATQPCVTLLSRTRGVWPISSVTSFAIRILPRASQASAWDGESLNTTNSIDITSARKVRRESAGFSEDRAARLSVSESVGNCGGGRPDVHVGNEMLELMMSSLVEKITDRDDPGGFSGKVQGERRRGAAENAYDRVQFPSTILKIGTSGGEVCATECGHSDKENAILPVKKLVRLESWLRNDGRRHRN